VLKKRQKKAKKDKVLQISKVKEVAYLERVSSCQINEIVIKNGGSSDK